MAKGAVAKETLLNKLQEIYPNAFMDGKVMRIPLDDGGNLVEIKVSLTCAKDIIGTATTVTKDENGDTFVSPADDSKPADGLLKPTQEELDNLSKLMDSLGL